jgi:Peptidase A4 family
MNRTTLIISALVLSLPGVSFSQSSPAPGTNSPLAPTPVRFSTNLPEATTTAAPSAGSPLTMTASQLAAWGFPPQPDPVATPQAYAVWVQAMTAAQTRMFPGLSRLARAHGPTVAAPGVNVSNSTSVVASAANSALGSYNWSGYLNTNASISGAAFTTVFAQYVIPRALQAPGACTGGWVYSSTWVGLDGAGAASNDVLQAGTNSDAYCNQQGSSANSQVSFGNYSPWYEWYPNNATLIWGLQTHAGDSIFVEVWSTSPTTGNVFMVDYNTQQYVSISLAPPAGVQLAGASAEWITELPTVSGNLPTLTNYVSEYMSGVFALDSNGALYDPSVSTPIVMVDSNTQPISYPTLLGTGATLLQSTGSVQ